MNVFRLITAFTFMFCITLLTQPLMAQTSVRVEVTSDKDGQEIYWELVPAGNPCGTGTIASGGNAQEVGCSGAEQQRATVGNGYANFTTFKYGPWTFPTGNNYSIISIDDWGDGGASFVVYVDEFPKYTFKAKHGSEVFTFAATPPVARNLDLNTINIYKYNQPKPITFTCDVFNSGATDITSVVLQYSANNAPTVTDTISGLNLKPFTGITLTIPSQWKPTTNGTYQLSVWIKSVNGQPDLLNDKDTIKKTVVIGDSIPNIVDMYLNTLPVFKVIGNSSSGVAVPRDLDFHPTLSNYELWVLNAGTPETGGSTVTFYNAGKPEQTSLYRQDGNAWHFMCRPTGIAFGQNENFATTTGFFDDNHGSNPLQHFSGPSLWSSDSLIYARPSGGNGSHIDMIHQSPYSMGITNEGDNTFWVFDGFNQYIIRYDYQQDHGPGNDDHTDGRLRAYTDIKVKRYNDSIPCHLVLDKSTGWLYVADNGNNRVFRMNINTGAASGTITPYDEILADFTNMKGVTWAPYITNGIVIPCGIDVIGNRLIVGDYSNGDIVIYDNTGATGAELGRIRTGKPGITGVKIGPDGKIWYTNANTSEVVRIDTATKPAGVQNGDREFSISVAPNPSNGRFIVNVQSVDSKSASVSVTNAYGTQVYDRTFNSVTGLYAFEINLQSVNAPKGVYILRIAVGDRVTYHKLIVE